MRLEVEYKLANADNDKNMEQQTALLLSPLMTLGQETRWASCYSSRVHMGPL